MLIDTFKTSTYVLTMLFIPVTRVLIAFWLVLHPSLMSERSLAASSCRRTPALARNGKLDKETSKKNSQIQKH